MREGEEHDMKKRTERKEKEKERGERKRRRKRKALIVNEGECARS
jgi:hypothetical protein